MTSSKYGHNKPVIIIIFNSYYRKQFSRPKFWPRIHLFKSTTWLICYKFCFDISLDTKCIPFAMSFIFRSTICYWLVFVWLRQTWYQITNQVILWETSKFVEWHLIYLYMSLSFLTFSSNQLDQARTVRNFEERYF